MTGVTVEFKHGAGTCSSSMGRNVYLSRKELTDAADFSSYGAQLFFDAFVAAIDVINAIDDGLTLGDEGG